MDSNKCIWTRQTGDYYNALCGWVSKYTDTMNYCTHCGRLISLAPETVTDDDFADVELGPPACNLDDECTVCQ